MSHHFAAHLLCWQHAMMGSSYFDISPVMVQDHLSVTWITACLNDRRENVGTHELTSVFTYFNLCAWCTDAYVLYMSPSLTSVYHLFSQSYDLSLQASLPNTAKLHTAVSMCMCVCSKREREVSTSRQQHQNKKDRKKYVIIQSKIRQRCVCLGKKSLKTDKKQSSHMCRGVNGKK